MRNLLRIINLLQIFAVINVTRCAVTLDTPCPNVLKYLPLEAAEEGTLEAEIHLATEDDLQGVWLHLVLDKKANSLLNWFGESTSPDNQEFAIRKPEYKLLAGSSLLVKIRVKYNAAEAPPSVEILRLNSKTICSVDRPHSTRSTTPSTRFRTSTSKSIAYSHLKSKTTPSSGRQQALFSGDLSHILNSNGNSSGGKNPRARGGSRLPPALVDVKCGVPVKRVVPLITNGKPSIEGAWPWHVALNTQELKYTCGGTLLTRTHVLTAAHCVAIHRSSQAADPDRFLVHLGITERTRFNPGLQERQLDHILVHPSYNYSNYRNDLAILTLASPADFTDYVRPICLTSDALSRDLTKEMGTVVGWGVDQHNTITELLHETEMPVVDLLTCIYSEPEVYSKLTSTNNFCAGFKNGTSVCNGDSGGGMFFERDDGDGGWRWELRGMVSFSVVGRNDLCNPNSYAVFTDILKYKDWIGENTREERR